MKSIDLTNSHGIDMNFISDKYKYKIFIKSILYNSNGAYYPLESCFIELNDKLYNSLNNENKLKDSYAYYYNNIKPDVEKKDKPKLITIDDIEKINIYELPSDYIPYYCR